MYQEVASGHLVAQHMLWVRLLQLLIRQLQQGMAHDSLSLFHLLYQFIPGNVSQAKFCFAVSDIPAPAQYSPDVGVDIADQVQAQVAGRVRNVAACFPDVFFLFKSLQLVCKLSEIPFKNGCEGCCHGLHRIAIWLIKVLVYLPEATFSLQKRIQLLCVLGYSTRCVYTY